MHACMRACVRACVHMCRLLHRFVTNTLQIIALPSVITLFCDSVKLGGDYLLYD